MMRAFLIEMAVFRDYVWQLLGLGFLVSLFISTGIQTPLAMPATLTCIFFMMAATGLATYDDVENWGLFRLTLPLSRRDVVFGRYVAIVVFGLAGTVVGIIGTLAMTGIASTVGLPGELGETFAFDAGLLIPMAFVASFTLFIGSAMASVVTPINFWLGQTRATPMVIALLFVAPVAILGNSGMLDGGIPGMELISRGLELLETPVGAAVGCVICIALAAAALAVSAVLSLKLYERREL